MLTVEQTTQFKRDVKKLRKQNKDMQRLFNVVKMLIHEEPLPAKYRDHALVGNWVNFRECHIQPDWLLIYYKTENTLFLQRSGSHSVLF